MGNSHCAALIASRDWTGTALGPVDDWPQSLRTMLGFLLRSPVPMVMLWGEAGIMLYNDAYSVFAGGRHPALLGAAVREGWPEVADFNDNVMRVGLAGGTLAYKDQELTLYRHGYAEQVFMDLDYSPVPGEDGQPAGVLAIVVETTERAATVAQLREAASALASAQEAGRVGSWRFVVETGETFWSESARRIFGLDPDAPVGRDRYIAMLHPDNMESVVAELDRIRASQSPAYEQELHIMRPDGSDAWVLARGRRVSTPDGKPTIEGIFIDVTERKKAQIEASRAEALLRAVIEGAPDPIFAKDVDGRYLLVNQAMLDLAGRGAEEVIGKTIDDVYGPTVAAGFLEADTKALAGEVAVVEERLTDGRSGEPRVLLATKSPLRGPDGTIAGSVTITRDVTERKAMEERLRASEARLRLAFEIGGIGAWDIDLLTGDVFESPEISAMYGLPPGQTNRHISETRARIHPDDREAVEAATSAAIASGETYAAENRVIRADGSVGWLAARGRALYDHKGKAVRAVGVTRDVTAERLTQQAIIESEDRFRTLTDYAPALIFAVDAKGRNSFVNRRYIEYTGRSFADLCGEGWTDCVHADDLAAVLAVSATATRDGRTVEHRLRIRRHDGSWRWFLSHVEPVEHDSPGTAFAWMGICIDIDEQVRTEERERLLAAEVDHRAKNMLAVVQAVVQLTRADTAAALKLAINDRIASLARAHGLLAESRWEGVNLGDLAREELAAFKDRVEIAGPDVRLRPAAAQALALVLHELTTNAVKYGALSVPNGTLSLTWGWSTDGKDRHLAARWTECGGPPVTPPETRGFGSTVMRSSVERQLGGRLTLDWRVTGLDCELRVPASQLGDAPEASPRLPASSPVVMPAGALSGQRILIVEDELLVAMQIEAMVTEVGCEVVGSAPSIAEAEAMLLSRGPTAVLLDINLGSERSYPFADLLITQGVPFAFCTGYVGDDEIPGRFRDCARLDKPVDPVCLAQVLARLAAS